MNCDECDPELVRLFGRDSWCPRCMGKRLAQQILEEAPVIHAAGVFKQALCREADAEIPPKERTVNFRLVTCPECAKVLTEMGK